MPEKEKTITISVREWERMRQDIADMRTWQVGFKREECGRIVLDGYVCFCGVDHNEDRRKRREARTH